MKPEQLAAAQRFLGWLSNPNLVYLDTETTGMNGQVVEIAICDRDGKTLLDTLVRPTCPIEIGASNVHHITEEMVVEAPSFASLWLELKALLTGKRVVIYNVDFDVKRLYDSARATNDLLIAVEARHLFFEQNSTEFVCAMKEYAAYHGEWDFKYRHPRWYKLAEALFIEELKIDEAYHRAMADVQATRLLVEHCARFAQVPEVLQ